MVVANHLDDFRGKIPFSREDLPSFAMSESEPLLFDHFDRTSSFCRFGQRIEELVSQQVKIHHEAQIMQQARKICLLRILHPYAFCHASANQCTSQRMFPE